MFRVSFLNQFFKKKTGRLREKNSSYHIVSRRLAHIITKQQQQRTTEQPHDGRQQQVMTCYVSVTVVISELLYSNTTTA